MTVLLFSSYFISLKNRVDERNNFPLSDTNLLEEKMDRQTGSNENLEVKVEHFPRNATVTSEDCHLYFYYHLRTLDALHKLAHREQPEMEPCQNQ